MELEKKRYFYNTDFRDSVIEEHYGRTRIARNMDMSMCLNYTISVGEVIRNGIKKVLREWVDEKLKEDEEDQQQSIATDSEKKEFNALIDEDFDEVVTKPNADTIVEQMIVTLIIDEGA